MLVVSIYYYLYYIILNMILFFFKYLWTYLFSFKEKLIEVIGDGSKESEWFLYTPLLKKILENAILDSKDEG